MKRNKRLAMLLCMAILCLTGCGQLEIEERAFPLALCISPSEMEGMYDFFFYFEEMESAGSSLYHKEDTVVQAGGYPQAYTMFGRVQAAQLDDSHMKVLLISEEFLEDAAAWESFLQYAMKEHHFSWNTMVYLFSAESDVPKQLSEGTGGRPASYLRAMAESDEQEKTASVPTLGDLYMERNNREKVLLLPMLAKSAPPFVERYRLLVNGVPDETLSFDEARLLQLLQGKLKQMLVEFSDGTVLEISGIRTKRTYVPEQARWQVTLCMEASVQNRLALTAETRVQLEEEAERLLREKLTGVVQWARLRGADGVSVLPEYVIDLKVIE